MNGLGWLILGLLVGWLIELVIDYRYWRKQAAVVAARQAQQDAALRVRTEALDLRERGLDARDQELSTLQTNLTAKDTELLAQAKRIDERAEELTRLEQATEKRRADLDKMSLTLNERDKEISSRLDTLKASEADFGVRQETLKSTESDLARRVAVVSNRESAMQSWETRILAREHEVADNEAGLSRRIAETDRQAANFSAMQNLLRSNYSLPDGQDDLQALEGIGPKIADLLHRADIRSFDRLAETPLGELTRVLESAGPRFGLANPLSWAEQAARLVEGDYVGFEALKDELVGGVRKSAVAEPDRSEPNVADSQGSGCVPASTDVDADANASNPKTPGSPTSVPDAALSSGATS